VQVLSLWSDWPVDDAVLQRVAASGAGWVRVDIGWCTLEEDGPGRHQAWYVRRLDAVVASARRLGLRILATVAGTPEWAGGGPTWNRPPRDPARFGDVMAWLAARYRGRVAAWELWNEANWDQFFLGGSATRYAGLLRAAYPRIKHADPAATVVSAGASGNDDGWLRELYRAGAKGLFDAVGMHPYIDPSDGPPDLPDNGSVYRMTHVVAVRDVMRACGDGATPIWFTEFGWSVGSATIGSHRYPGVTQAEQADYLGRALELVQRRYPYVQAMFWFTARDRIDSNARENGFGLLRHDLTARPALGALARTTARWRSQQLPAR
jgi:hypothetical protein